MDNSIGDRKTMAGGAKPPADDLSLGDGRTVPGRSDLSLPDRSLGDGRTMRPGGAGSAGRLFVEGELLLGRYRVRGGLGRGAMGVVYRCRDETAGIEVALKALPPEVSRSSGEMEEVRANFRLVEGLHHPNIANVKTLERDPESGDFYLVMELVDGYDVRQWVRRRRDEGRPLTLDEITIIAYRVASALDYAHEEGVIHRDIKPGNVRVDFAGNVKVLDFGLAARGGETSGVCGTPPYMAPEQWEGRTQGAAADQFALAATVCELIHDAPPFGSGDPAAVREAALTREPALPEGQPTHVNAAMRRALSKDPALRFATCGEFVRALAGNGSECRASSVECRQPEVGSQKSDVGGRKWLWAAAALAVLSAVVLGALLRGSSGARKPSGNPPVEGKAYAVDLGGGLTLEMAWIPRAEGFWLGRTEVTVDQWRRFVDATGYITDAETGGSVLCYDVKSGIVKSGSGMCWRNPGFAQAGDHPVVCVSWNDMKAFCRWVNSCSKSAGWLPSGFEYRLPGEAEWIFACKGGHEGTKYWWGDTLAEGEGRINCAGAESLWTPHLPWNDGYVFTSPCGFYGAKGRNGYGLSDMIGNAWEICEDDYSPGVGPQETIFKANTKERVIRGCPAYDSVAEHDRGKAFFSRSYPTSGFRLCLGKMVDKSAEQKSVAQKSVPVVPSAKERVASEPSGRSPVEGRPYTVDLGGRVTLEMAWIPPGTTTLGSSQAERDWAMGPEGCGTNTTFEDDGPLKQVKIDNGFWLGRTEVTVGQWQQFVAATKYVTDAERKGSAICVDLADHANMKQMPGRSWRNPENIEQSDDYPVVCVSWNDVKAFCNWLTDQARRAGKLSAGMQFRLPGEAEWSYACRGGREGTKFWWGDSLADGKGRMNGRGTDRYLGQGGAWRHRYDWADGHFLAGPCGGYGPKGQNGFGLSDMLGNVAEWCEDSYDVTGAHETIWTDAGSIRKAVRGGTFCSVACNLRCADRCVLTQNSRMSNVGFRLCLGKAVRGPDGGASAAGASPGHAASTVKSLALPTP